MGGKASRSHEVTNSFFSNIGSVGAFRAPGSKGSYYCCIGCAAVLLLYVIWLLCCSTVVCSAQRRAYLILYENARFWRDFVIFRRFLWFCRIMVPPSSIARCHPLGRSVDRRAVALVRSGCELTYEISSYHTLSVIFCRG